MRRVIKLALGVTLSLGALSLAGKSSATTLLQVPGPVEGYFDFGGGALADSWTQDFAVTDGSVSVTIAGADSGGAVDFYLTTAIGPGATLSNLVAFASIDVPYAVTSLTPFQNLNLGPGTYYMIIADYPQNTNNPAFGAEWLYRLTALPNIQTVPGLTINPFDTRMSRSVSSRRRQAFIRIQQFRASWLLLAPPYPRRCPCPPPSACFPWRWR